jgi:hypothetical protein
VPEEGRSAPEEGRSTPEELDPRRRRSKERGAAAASTEPASVAPAPRAGWACKASVAAGWARKAAAAATEPVREVVAAGHSHAPCHRPSGTTARLAAAATSGEREREGWRGHGKEREGASRAPASARDFAR